MAPGCEKSQPGVSCMGVDVDVVIAIAVDIVIDCNIEMYKRPSVIRRALQIELN